MLKLCMPLAILLFTGEAPEINELDGAWRLESMSSHGQMIPLPPRYKVVYVFGEDGRLLIRKTGFLDERSTFKVGNGLLTKDIDIIPTVQGSRQLGVYKVEGDWLTIATINQVVGRRPGRPNDVSPGPGIMLLKLKKTASIASSQKPLPLAGRWELIAEGKADSLTIQIADEPGSETNVEIHRGGSSGDEVFSTRCHIEPFGWENSFALSEEAIKDGQARGRLTRFCFRGEKLELYGAVRLQSVEIDLTGEYRRVEKNK